jgi:hypothetical protein
MSAAFAVPCRVLASAPAVRRAVLTLVFAAGIVLFGWVLSGQAQASESTDGTGSLSVPVVDGAPVAGALDALTAPVADAVAQPAPAEVPDAGGFETYRPGDALTVPVAENGPDVPSAVLGQAAKFAEDLRAKGETAFRPIVDRVGRDLPQGFPVKPGAGRTPAASAGGSHSGVVAVTSAAPTNAAHQNTAPQIPASSPQIGKPSGSGDELHSAARSFADREAAAQKAGTTGGASHPPVPAHQSSSPDDDAVSGSAQRGGAPGGVPVTAAPVAPARFVPMTVTGEAVADPIDRPEEVLVSPA